MALRYLTTVAALLQYAHAQDSQSRIVPQDLQTGFNGGATQVQVSYDNRAVDGFEDGTQFEKNAVSQEPTFALGDSSGISPTLLFTIIMVDTTCTGKRTLHYARANFKNNFDITNIKTDSAALQAYKAPGSFGETGDNRQYSFLMYTNPNRQPINNLKLPAEGAVFDVKQFQTDNNLPDAQAGVGMIVKLGGQADCGGDQTNTVPASSFPTARSTTTAARTSTAGAGSKPTSAAGAAPSSNAGAASSSGLSSSAVAGASSTTAARRPSTLTSSSAAQNPGNDNNSAPVSSARRPSSSATAPTPAQSDAAEPSDSAEEPNGAATTVRTSGRPVGSPTASSSVAQQTANAAPGKSMEHMRLFAAFMAVAGLMFW